MKVYRIERARYLNEALKGLGSALSKGARWNSFQTRMVYSAASRALAILEIAVHLDLGQDLPNDRLILEIDIPDKLDLLKKESGSLPEGWNAIPPTKISQRIGDDFIRNENFAVLRVPSVIVPQEFNYLINPLHQDIANIQITDVQPLVLDSRLSGRLTYF
jgi:RES domain-containing protein